MYEKNVTRLKKLLDKYVDIFRVKLGSDPAVKVDPMRIQLRENTVPTRVKPRRYSQDQLQFLDRKIKELEQLGLIYKNSGSTWACTPHLVPKAGPERWRFTMDLRPVNKVTVPHAWPMPHMDTVTAKLAGKNCFASIDLC